MNIQTRFRKKFCVSLVSIALSMASIGAEATVIKNTVVKGTNVNGSSGDKSQATGARVYDKPILSPQEITAQVKAQTMELNALLKSTTEQVILHSTYGDPNMILLASDNNRSVDINSVVEREDIISGELKKRQLEEFVATKQWEKGRLSKEELDAQVMRTVFPVETAMTPTRIPIRELKLRPGTEQAVTQPMAVIGVDKYSLAWFKSNLGVIRRMNAVVIVTQVDNLTDLQALQKFAPDLTYQPMDAEHFLRMFGISVYPILVTRNGAIQ
jgi:integrating conjugative element protein (TIGR03765 family)